MKFTASFSNPLVVTAYTGTALALGWAIRAHWGHNLSAIWMLFIAAVFRYLHDVVITLVLVMTIARALSSNRP